MSDRKANHDGVTREAAGAAEAAASRAALLEVPGREYLKPLTVVFVRHGVTDMTVSHQFSGSDVDGPPLNAAGRVQAAKAADAVYDIGRRTWTHLPTATRVIASPMTRTQETARSVGRRLGVHIETEPLLREVAFGEWEGLTGAEIVRRDADAVHRWRLGDIAAPGGESIGDVGVRVDEALTNVAAEHARLSAQGHHRERAWVAVSHAVAIKSAVGVSLGVDRRSWGAIWPQPASLTIMQLRVTHDGQIGERHLLCLGAPTD